MSGKMKAELEAENRELKVRLSRVEQRLQDCDILLSEVSILTQKRADVARVKNAEVVETVA